MGTIADVRFFEDLPRPDRADEDRPDPQLPAWAGPPEDVLGCVVPLSEVVVRTEHVFIGLRSLTAYPTGLTIDLQLAGRRQGRPPEEWRVVREAFLDLPLRRSAPLHDRALRFGMELADGRRLGAEHRLARDPFGDGPQPPVLVERGGGASGGSRTVHRHDELWLWPLLPDPAVSLVLQWADVDVPLTYHRIDLSPVRAALSRAAPYWP